MVIKLLTTLLELSPTAQLLLILCFFLLILALLLIIAFSPDGAWRLSHFLEQLQHPAYRRRRYGKRRTQRAHRGKSGE